MKNFLLWIFLMVVFSIGFSAGVASTIRGAGVIVFVFFVITGTLMAVIVNSPPEKKNRNANHRQGN